MRRKVGSVSLCLAVFLLLLTACALGEATSETPLSAMVIKGPSAISTVSLISENDDRDAAPYAIRVVGSPDEVVSAISNGSVDLAVVPTNLAASLYNKTEGDVCMVAITNLGSLFLVENKNEITSLADLKEKTIYSGGQGANPQFIFEYLLSQAGLVVGKDVFVEYVAEQSEAVAFFAAGKADIVLLPEPFTSVALAKNPEARVAVDLGEVWADETGNNFAMSCVIARIDYLEKNSEHVHSFMDDLQHSVEFASADLEACAKLCVAYEVLPDYEIALAAIPRCRIVYAEQSEMKDLVGDYYKVLYGANPASIGGSIPDDSLFYER